MSGPAPFPPHTPHTRRHFPHFLYYLPGFYEHPSGQRFVEWTVRVGAEAG